MKPWFPAALLVAVLTSALLVIWLAGSQGSGIVFPLAVPVLLAAVPLLTPVRFRAVAGWAAAGLVTVGVLVSILSIGVFFLPTAALLAVGAVRG